MGGMGFISVGNIREDVDVFLRERLGLEHIVSVVVQRTFLQLISIAKGSLQQRSSCNIPLTETITIGSKLGVHEHKLLTLKQ